MQPYCHQFIYPVGQAGGLGGWEAARCIALLRHNMFCIHARGTCQQDRRWVCLDSFRPVCIMSVSAVVLYAPRQNMFCIIHTVGLRHITGHCCIRVGRTGRAGDKDGTAWTLLDAKRDSHFAGLLLNSLTLSGQDVPPALHALAMKVSARGCFRGKQGARVRVCSKPKPAA
jgi:hypothetical protein